MSATIHTSGVAAPHRIRNLAGRTWPALLTLMTLACVTPPSPADASQAVARGPACDGGPCGERDAGVPAPASTDAGAVPAPSDAGAVPAPSTAAPPSSTPAPQTPPADAGVGRAAAACDRDWPDGRHYIIQLERRDDDGKPLEPFNPRDPMQPYQFRGESHLYCSPGMVYTAVGRFDDRQEAEAAYQQMRELRYDLHVSLTSPGAYLTPESRTCRVTPMARMKNPVINPASWILEKEGVLLAGTQSACSDGMLTKKVAIMTCDGMKNLLTDTVEHVCERNRRIDTCVYTLEPGILLLEHTYGMSGQTSVHVRVQDVRKKKRLYTLDVTNGSGIPGLPDTEPTTDLEDIDQDGIPEIVKRHPETGQRLSVLKWSKGRFTETSSP